MRFRALAFGIAGLELVWGAGFATAALAVSPPAMPVQATYRGFQFSPGRTCETPWIDSSFCEATQPRRWTDGEIDALERLLAPLFDGRLDGFLERIARKGFNTFYRYGHCYRAGESGRYEREDHGAWVSARDRGINMTDLVFQNGMAPDPIAGFDTMRFMVLHELAHAYAADEPRLMAAFGRLVGWTLERGEWALKGIDMGQVRQAMAAMRARYREGRVAEGMRVNREFGMSHGFPSAYSMQNPDESFADFVAMIYFDPRAGDYLPARVVRWFRQKVLL